ncbi:hypothetical protein GWI33_018541 [Rhynchophorus ferrugineus]|uniref:G-protein coupled receptors family 2 profile 2 domain-containing protein n=1 Tax=Rhynchophorus ferrugineus TaxID=354439 RepID=A0A834HWR5_RHYFE|nr:hypothetical protein GWI33_018541 [Rhynchophorus ferrugineus]
MNTTFALLFLVCSYTFSIVYGTNSDVCNKRICIRKCCDYNEARDITHNICVESNSSHPFANIPNVHVIPNQICRTTEYAIYASINQTQFFSNGSINVPIYGDHGSMLSMNQYCFDNMNGEPGVFICIPMENLEEEERKHVTFGLIVLLLIAFTSPYAEEIQCDADRCLRKCCDLNESVNMTKMKCVPSNYVHPFSKLEKTQVIPKQRCTSEEHTVKYHVNDTKFSSDGTLTVEQLGKYGYMLPMNRYCFDYMDDQPGVFVCIPKVLVTEQPRGHVTIGMIISMPFLFITFLVYLILPDKNVHQYALMLYVLTLLLAYVLLVTINLSESLPTFFCTGAAYGTLFLFMVSFFWMNVICFDIWYTFSGGRGYIVSSRKSERKRFLIYTAYAVGIPILHVCIVALLDKYLDEESIHKPNIGIKKCFLDDGWPSLWYMYGEAAILVLINVVFFTLTALKIRQVKKETLMLKQNESKRHALEKEKRREIVTDFYRFNLFLKLFLAMGVNWTMEVISWLVNWQTTDKYTYIWYITDFINAVYGGVIFFIFVFKRKIWKMLQKRYYNFIGKPHLARAVTTTTDTRTSHYSSATDTNLTERTNITERRNNGIPTEELALRRA